MRAWTILFFLLTIVMVGCTQKDKDIAQNNDNEVFAQKVFDTIIQRDADMFIELCAHAEDIDLDGKPLLSESYRKKDGIEWIETLKISFDYFLKEIDRTGGVESLEWVGLGKVMGRLPSESGFIGNIYIKVKINGIDYIIEIGGTQISRDRGRVIIDSTPFILRTMSYYKKNT